MPGGGQSVEMRLAMIANDRDLKSLVRKVQFLYLIKGQNSYEGSDRCSWQRYTCGGQPTD